jgi:apolipoprotein N-acyltransferase
MHRVPFGEFVPWVDGWPWAKRLFLHYLTPYDFDYTLKAGKQATVFDVSPRSALSAVAADVPVTSRVVAPICFEDASPGTTLEMLYGGGAKRADMLANLTNSGWYVFSYRAPWMERWYGLPLRPIVRWLFTSHQAAQELQIATFRCVETRAPMARSVNTGISGFIDSLGRIGPVVESDGRLQEIDGVAVHEMTADPRRTLFGAVGHWPVFIVMGVTAALAVGGLMRGQRRA